MVFITSLFLSVLSIVFFTVYEAVFWMSDIEVISREDLAYVIMPIKIHESKVIYLGVSAFITIGMVPIILFVWML